MDKISDFIKNAHFPAREWFRAFFLIAFGGMVYYNFEILCRGYSHYSMMICGGLSFYSIGLLNEGRHNGISLLKQMLWGALIITGYEFLTGILVNVIFGLHVWDYSGVPLNIKGQVCLPFSLLWFFITPVCIFTDDLIRYALFGRALPDYLRRARKKYS